MTKIIVLQRLKPTNSQILSEMPPFFYNQSQLNIYCWTTTIERKILFLYLRVLKLNRLVHFVIQSLRNCQFCQTWPAKFGQILQRTDTRLVFCKGLTQDWYFTKDWHKIGILQRTDTRLVFYQGLTQDWYFTKNWHKIGILQRTYTRLVFYKGLTQDWYFTIEN
jgi:hypothetical protein